MSDYRCWLINHLVSSVTDSEGEVGVFVVSRRITIVKSTELVEQMARDHDAGPGAVIHLAGVVVPGMAGVIKLPVVPAAGILPDDTPGLLQAPIRIDQLGPH